MRSSNATIITLKMIETNPMEHKSYMHRWKGMKIFLAGLLVALLGAFIYESNNASIGWGVRIGWLLFSLGLVFLFLGRGGAADIILINQYPEFFLRIAWILIIIGILLVVYCYRLQKDGAVLFPGDVFLMCPECGEAFNCRDVSNDECPACRIPLENIEGFYKRHPEWVDKSNVEELKRKIGLNNQDENIKDPK